MSYQTNRLTIVPMTIPFLESMLKGPDFFKASTSYTLPEPYTEFPDSIAYTIKSLQNAPSRSPWHSYALILISSSTYIGQAGFKSEPDDLGQVELGYEITLGYRLQGFAQEVIHFMLDIAFQSPGITAVTAHTLAEHNESNHLLIKNGFLYKGSLLDDDIKVWYWVLPKKAYQFKGLLAKI